VLAHLLLQGCVLLVVWPTEHHVHGVHESLIQHVDLSFEGSQMLELAGHMVEMQVLMPQPESCLIQCLLSVLLQ
jgi:hypothetical protein